jgi:sulfide:quinone oxidoreductase
MTAGEAHAMGHDDAEVTVVTPEWAPISLFGTEASQALAEELDRAGVHLRTGVVGVMREKQLRLQPGDELLDAQRAYAVPRILGLAIGGLPCDHDGFIEVDDLGKVLGCDRTWAAGDGAVSPIKFGGLATHQARRIAAAVTREMGVHVPDPGEPVLHGSLLVGERTRRLRGRGDGEAAPLWWPAGKVAGLYLPRWLAEHGLAPHGAGEAIEEPGAAEEPGVAVQRPVSAIEPSEAEYLRDVAREFRSADPAIASLGRRMHEFEQR